MVRGRGRVCGNGACPRRTHPPPGLLAARIPPLSSPPPPLSAHVLCATHSSVDQASHPQRAPTSVAPGAAAGGRGGCQPRYSDACPAGAARSRETQGAEASGAGVGRGGLYLEDGPIGAQAFVLVHLVHHQEDDAGEEGQGEEDQHGHLRAEAASGRPGARAHVHVHAENEPGGTRG